MFVWILILVFSPQIFPGKVFGIKNKEYNEVIHFHPISEEISCNQNFSIAKSESGTFNSSKYPAPYPQNRHCKVELRGDKDHKVILKFEEFYLFHPSGHHHKKHTSCDGLDILRIYDGLSKNDKILGEFCGGMKPPTLMSSGPHLSLRLTTYTSRHEAQGYIANYSFVSDFGITSGEQHEPGKCSFEFDSNEKKEDFINSPNPGGLYPRNTNCTYIFQGTFLQRVFLQFQLFDLEGIEPCTAESGSDFLEFSNSPDHDPCPSRRCGRFSPQEVVSEGPYFRMTFRSNGRLSGYGFSARYSFLSDEELPEWASYLRGRANTINVKESISVFLQLWISWFVMKRIS